MRAAEGFGNDPVDQAVFEQAYGGQSQRIGGMSALLGPSTVDERPEIVEVVIKLMVEQLDGAAASSTRHRVAR